MNHTWKEEVFDPHGEYKGMKCMTQTFKCKSCDEQITLPDRVTPPEGVCKDENIKSKTTSHTKRKIQRGGR